MGWLAVSVLPVILPVVENSIHYPKNQKECNDTLRQVRK
jgi:hypothetical protein